MGRRREALSWPEYRGPSGRGGHTFAKGHKSVEPRTAFRAGIKPPVRTSQQSRSRPDWSPDGASIRDKSSVLARQLSAWQEKLGLAEHDAWQKLTYGLNQEIPAIRSDRLDALEALAAWLLGQSWPTTFPRVRIAFIRHAYALRALLSALRNYTEAHGSARRLERLYQRLERWDPPEYQRLLRETQLRQQVIWYLVTELSRSVNLIIQAVREEVDPGFRIVEGFVLSMEPGIMNMYLVRAVRELGLGRSSAIPVARTDQVGDRGQGCGKWY